MKHILFALLFIASISSCQNDKPAMKEKDVTPATKTEQAQENGKSTIDITMTGNEFAERSGRAPHPEFPFHHNAAIYEVNTRQFSKEGSFARVTEQLGRLSSMGVKIVWMMPIHPIGEKNRKGGLGSPYSISDYKGINPEFGTLSDFKNLVKTAHSRGMKVIIDWVANHSAFDNVWATDHLDYYTLKNGKQIVATDNDGKATDWTDVADLNYDNPEMRAAMIDAMKYWITECDIDGFRCDVAGFVPLDFWVDARAQT